MSFFLILSHLALATGCILAVYMIVRINREQRSPGGAIAWLLVIILIPFIGIPFYLMFGGRKMQRLRREKADLAPEAHENELPQELTVVSRVFRGLGLPGVTTGNKVRLCRTGEDIYKDCIDLILRSEESIFITTYILSPDEVGKELINCLSAKAAAGVDVRLLLDAVGSRAANKKFLQPFHDSGGKTAFFMPVFKFGVAGRAHLRNHRKLMVFDEKWALSGGANLAREYIGPTPLEGRWKDLSFVLEGPAVKDYAEIFAADWAFASDEKIQLKSEPPKPLPGESEGGAIVQVVPSGPDVPGDYLYDAILTTVFEARKRLWIATPYFVPDETLAKALQIAAHRGVDVCVITPERSNHRFVDAAGKHPLREIVAAGGRALYYTPGMMHAKVMVMDDLMAVIGSANMDMRSLFLNYEAVMIAYSQPEIKAVETWIESLMAHSRPFDPKISVYSEFGEGIVRMAAPLL